VTTRYPIVAGGYAIGKLFEFSKELIALSD